MNLHDLGNGLVLAATGSVALLAQADPTIGTIVNSVIQAGAVGGILLWITFVDIPARNKAAADREVAAEKSALARETTWKDQLQAERLASQTREELFRVALEKVATSIATAAASQGALSAALDQLADELREERVERSRNR